jgi:CBS domain-containing protein
VGSILVRDASGGEAGMVTDRDLRRAVALGVSVDAPVETMMSVPVESIEATESNFEALARMMGRGIHHLAVTEGGVVKGVISSQDILVEQGVSPMTLYRRILDARDYGGVYFLAGKLPLAARALLDEGASARDLNRLITILSDAVRGKILSLLHREYGPSPIPYCWLVLGGEGRGERSLASDQDNAIVHEDREDPVIQRAGAIYFEALAKKAVEHLSRCGLPRCPGGMNADQGGYRLSYSGWKERFAAVVADVRPEEAARGAALFDFRAGHGREELARDLRAAVGEMARDRGFLARLARPCLEADPPLSFFREFLVEQDGGHKDALDLKRRGLAVFVDFARVLALAHGVEDTGTRERLSRLERMGVLPGDLAREVRESFAFLTQLRLSRQLAASEAGREPDHFVDPAGLSELERRLLKDSFALVRRMQDFLKGALRELA